MPVLVSSVKPEREEKSLHGVGIGKFKSPSRLRCRETFQLGHMPQIFSSLSPNLGRNRSSSFVASITIGFRLDELHSNGISDTFLEDQNDGLCGRDSWTGDLSRPFHLVEIWRIAGFMSSPAWSELRQVSDSREITYCACTMEELYC